LPLVVLVDRSDQIDLVIVLAGDQIRSAHVPRIDEMLTRQQIAHS
jgi:hypothetical protein